MLSNPALACVRPWRLNFVPLLPYTLFCLCNQPTVPALLFALSAQLSFKGIEMKRKLFTSTITVSKALNYIMHILISCCCHSLATGRPLPFPIAPVCQHWDAPINAAWRNPFFERYFHEIRNSRLNFCHYCCTLFSWWLVPGGKPSV